MSSQPKSARETAFYVLERAKSGAWSDSALKSAIRSNALSPRDSALCSRICYGVQQNQLLLDYWISCFSRVPVEKLESAVLTALRMGLYQIALMDRVPERAAVNESVELVKRSSRNPNSSRLTNGILRAFCRREGDWPQAPSLSVQYSHPQWLVNALAAELPGGDVEPLLAADNSQPPTTIQVNTLRTTTQELANALAERGVGVRLHPWLPDCLELTGTGDLEELPQFRAGDFTVQDAAAKLAVLAADPQPGDRVLDACAAPGGKSFAAAVQMQDRGELFSCDIQPKKVRLIRDGAKRLGISILTAEVRNGKAFYEDCGSKYDLVLADVPCSGLGIIRKKPDIRYKNPDSLGDLPDVQRAILDNVSRYVKPGGTLLYATCTVLRRENRDVVEGFLADHPAFRLEPFRLPGPVGDVPEGMVTLWPHLHGTDGFFMAKLRKEHD
ncbi:MAG: 16S rRNA (cytosine(967)-C(5))-methyltransferase RsmB [Clostridiales bacterium]|nr:16S rRNA (cytosine(967)-C(5))-methyltransferase RsmB [Clostridiales bacterium]